MALSKRKFMEIQEVYKSSPPPSIGWWPVSTMLGVEAYRWWDGKVWSWPAFSFESADKAGYWATKKETPKDSKGIFWADRPANWPKRSLT